MEKFKLGGEDMNQLLADLKKAQEKMESAYEKVKQLEEQIEGEGAWKGKERDTFLTYFRLMKEYHKCFTHSGQKSRGNPMQEAVEALEELGVNADNFYADFSEYRKINNI